MSMIYPIQLISWHFLRTSVQYSNHNLEVDPKALHLKKAIKRLDFFWHCFFCLFKVPSKTRILFFLFRCLNSFRKFSLLYCATQTIYCSTKNAQKQCLLNKAYKPQRRTSSSLVLVFSSKPNIIQVPCVGMSSTRNPTWRLKLHTKVHQNIKSKKKETYKFSKNKFSLFIYINSISMKICPILS